MGEIVGQYCTCIYGTVAADVRGSPASADADPGMLTG